MVSGKGVWQDERWACLERFKLGVEQSGIQIVGTEARTRLRARHETVLLQCAVDRCVLLERLQGVGGPAEGIGHGGDDDNDDGYDYNYDDGYDGFDDDGGRERGQKQSEMLRARLKKRRSKRDRRSIMISGMEAALIIHNTRPGHNLHKHGNRT